MSIRYDEFYRVEFTQKFPETREEKENPREKIIQLIKQNPTITQKELAQTLGLTPKWIEWHIKNLKNEGRLKRVGATKKGYWEVVE